MKILLKKELFIFQCKVLSKPPSPPLWIIKAIGTGTGTTGTCRCPRCSSRQSCGRRSSCSLLSLACLAGPSALQAPDWVSQAHWLVENIINIDEKEINSNMGNFHIFYFPYDPIEM